MADLIDRQAAIDDLFELYEYQRDIDPTEAADLVRQGVFLAEKRIERLPSAQPEIIYCRECKFASGDSRICMKSGYSPIGELDFCAWAERRTDEIN